MYKRLNKINIKLIGLREFIQKYISQNEKVWYSLESILKIQTYSQNDVLDLNNFIYFINSGHIKATLDSNQKLDFYNYKKDMMFFNYSFCFVSDYSNLVKKEKSKRTFYFTENCELILIEYSKLKLLSDKYKELEKFEKILLEFERNRIKKQIYKLLLEIDSK
ncbi:MAG: hypothetical protein PHE16_10860 [Aliarcobacter sp.]|nr:hypothetical protein [Aliarcobacter sp.]